MAEFQASAQTMVGNYSGSCLLHLTGAAITIKFKHAKDAAASWPYNCIRQFRADEETRQFSFFSGRRGPYGVAEYKFDMTEQQLLALQEALTQFTGAQFGGGLTPTIDVSGGTPGNTVGVSSVSSPVTEQRYAPETFRGPKRAPLPQIPGGPPSNADVHPGYMTHDGMPNSHTLQNHKHSAMDVFATLPKDPRGYHPISSSSPARPPVPIPYNSHTLGSRAKWGSPSINMKYSYHEVAGNVAPQGNFAPQGNVAPMGGWGNWISGSPVHVPSPKAGGGGRKWSHGDEVFHPSTAMSPVRIGKLVRQSTVPTSYKMRQLFEDTDSPQQGGMISPTPVDNTSPNEEDGASDLDFGPLRRSSPHVDRRSARRGRISPTDGSTSSTSSPRHDLYSVPRPSGSSSSPPIAENVYNVPRPQPGDPSLSQESAEVPATFMISPTEKDSGLYNVPKPINDGSDVYSTPRPHRQLSSEEMASSVPDVGGAVIYNVPSSIVRPLHQPQHPKMVRPPEDGRHEAVPNPSTTNGSHQELHNTPKPMPGAETTPLGSNGEAYNVPRAALESYVQQQQESDDGLYKVPRSLDVTSDGLYNVPKPSEGPSTYDSLQTVHDSTEYQVNNGRGPPSSVQYPMSSRQPLPTPDQDTYSIPRPASSATLANGRHGGVERQRYPYDYVDHTLPRAVHGTLKTSRSLESLVRNRVNLSPEAPSNPPTGRSYRTPSPRARDHKYIEIDIDDFTSPPSSSSGSPVKRGHLREEKQRRKENLYTEIKDSQQFRRSSHPENSVQQNTDHYTLVPSNLPASAVSINNTPQPLEGGGRKYLSQSSGNGASKEAMALHDEGYELVLPAENVARNMALHQQRQQPSQPLSIPRAQSVSQRAHATNGKLAAEWGVARLGTSGPLNQGRETDEYVIVNRRDVNQPTMPRDIPVVPLPQAHGNVPQSFDTASSHNEQYEVMTSVKKQVGEVDRGGYGGPQFTMVPPVPTKKRGSVSSTSHGSIVSASSLPRSDLIGRQSLRDSFDLDSIDTGSQISTGSPGHLDDLVGPLSPVDSGASPINVSHPLSATEKKNVIRIASGSPHDPTPSKELKQCSNSVENILDEHEGGKSQKYENVTDESIAKHVPSTNTQLPKRPPMPLPRPTRPEH